MFKDLGKNSKFKGTLSKGCEICAQGRKMVLLVTGLCHFNCFYCPLSEKKRGKNVVYANEKLVDNNEDIVYEAKSIDALGAGITGGEPLNVVDRTLDYITLLKDEFGDDFHIHLYTASCNKEAYNEHIKKLADVGLDEIRFHPHSNLWKKMHSSKCDHMIKKAMNTPMDVGVEIPCLPNFGIELKGLVKYLDDIGIQFLNLNELEFSETNCDELKIRGYEVKNDISSGVKGSEELALEILKEDVDIAIHYCSSSFKDAVQLRNRIMRRAKNVAKESDIITHDGTLLKGIIECERLKDVKKELMKKFDIPEDLIFVDEEKNRIQIAPWILEEIADEIKYNCFIIEEYPTADRLEVERRRV